ncbi:hypothetical protein [Ascidiaceihabitans sp.]|uniref:hypothetical protein n=1 Tax=Ascidiaceihabitans sp. TaxID=1872644 RepID=UPI0032968F13
MKKLSVFCAALCAAIAAPAIAAPKTYDCAITSKVNSRGFIPKKIRMVLDVKNSSAKIFYPGNQAGEDVPIASGLRTTSGGKYRMGYVLEMGTRSAGMVRVNYVVRFNPKRLGYTIGATVQGYDNRESNKGQCKPIS